MPGALRNAIDLVSRDLAAAGVLLPPDFRGSIRTALLPLDLDILDPREPDDLIRAHFAFMSLDLDDVTTITFLQAMHDLLAANARQTKEAIAKVGHNQFMTRIVLTRRLASRYFHEGRRRVDDDASVDSGVWLLNRSVRLTLGIVDRDDRASSQVLRMMHSQIATACAHLARALPRDAPRRAELLRTGAHHSREASQHGDRSPDHDGYAIELALRLHELSPGDQLAQVIDAIERTHRTATRTLQGLNGDVCFARTMDARDQPDAALTMTHLRKAIEHYDRALGLPEDKNGPDVGYLLAKRGRSHALMHEHAVNAVGGRDTYQLDRALSDWLDPRSEPHRRGHEAARMLLARARLASAGDDTQRAASDIAQAASLLAHDPAPGAEGRLERQTLEIALERALDAGDPDDALGALAASASLPVDAPVPAGSMTKAALWLQRHLPGPDWEEVARPVLDRVEADAMHPALTHAARGHIAGHAATLARVVARSPGGGPADALRAMELSRAHIQASPTRSAAAFDGASQAADAYASLSQDTTEAPSVEGLGIRVDALSWGLSALRTEQTVRTTVQTRFDIGGCAVRVAEAASKILGLTGDESYIEMGMDALDIAEALTADRAIGQNPDPRIASARRSLSEVLAEGPESPSGGLSIPSRPALEAWHRLSQADRAEGETAEKLRRQAAGLFCEIADTDDHNLGGKVRQGRRGVTIVDEPSGLARQLVVLKRLDKAGANREFSTISRIAAWRAARRPTPPWQVPEVLGVVDMGEDATLVLRRLPGHTLAHHVLEHLDGRGTNPVHMFEKAVCALGDFHASMVDHEPSRADNVTATLFTAAERLTNAEVGHFATGVFGSLIDSAPPLAKKDAHAGNWIWSAAAGGLIMLDIEGATSTRPAMLELAILLDDLPLIELNDAGWETRLRLTDAFAARLPLTHRPPRAQMRQLFEAGMLFTAVTGQARLHRRSWGSSSQGIRYARHQQRHYGDIISHLSNNATTRDLRQGASAILGARRPEK